MDRKTLIYSSLGLLCFILLLGNLLLGMAFYEANSQNEALSSQIAEKNQTVNELNSQVSTLSSRTDNLSSTNSELETDLEQLEFENEEYENKLNQGRVYANLGDFYRPTEDKIAGTVEVVNFGDSTAEGIIGKLYLYENSTATQVETTKTISIGKLAGGKWTSISFEVDIGSELDSDDVGLFYITDCNGCWILNEEVSNIGPTESEDFDST